MSIDFGDFNDLGDSNEPAGFNTSELDVKTTPKKVFF